MPRLWHDLLTPQGEDPPMWTFSSLQIPPGGVGPDPTPFFSWPTRLNGDLPFSFACIGFLLPVSSYVSMRIIPHLDVFLICLLGEVSSHPPTPPSWTPNLLARLFLLFNFFNLNFFNLFLAALGLRCCMQTFSSCGERRLLFIAVQGLLVVASLVAEHGL